MKKLLSVLFCLLSSLSLAATFSPITPDKLLWKDVTDMPKGAKVAILMGDPSKKQPFVARVKLPADYILPVHKHPINEYDTVLSGTYYFGQGNHFDSHQADDILTLCQNKEKLSQMPVKNFLDALVKK